MADKNVKVSIDILGERALESIFDHIERVPDDWRPAWEKMAEDFWSQNRKTFEEEGPGWAPLSPRYAKWKEEHFLGRPILVRTGKLRASLTTGFAEGSIFDVRPTEMTLGTSVDYAMYHQTGNLQGKFAAGTHPPKRSPVVVTPELQRKWNNRLANWLREEIDYRG